MFPKSGKTGGKRRLTYPVRCTPGERVQCTVARLRAIAQTGAMLQFAARKLVESLSQGYEEANPRLVRITP